MSRSVNAQVNSFSLNDGFITLLELTPYGGSTTYLCNDNVDQTVGGQVYNAYPFELPLLDERPGDIPSPSLVVDNTSREIIAALRAVHTAGTVRVKIVWISNLATVIDWCEYKLRRVQYNLNTIIGTLTLAFLQNDAFPAHSVTPKSAPGSFGRLNAS